MRELVRTHSRAIARIIISVEKRFCCPHLQAIQQIGWGATVSWKKTWSHWAYTKQYMFPLYANRGLIRHSIAFAPSVLHRRPIPSHFVSLPLHSYPIFFASIKIICSPHIYSRLFFYLSVALIAQICRLAPQSRLHKWAEVVQDMKSRITNPNNLACSVQNWWTIISASYSHSWIVKLEKKTRKKRWETVSAEFNKHRLQLLPRHDIPMPSLLSHSEIIQHLLSTETTMSVWTYVWV